MCISLPECINISMSKYSIYWIYYLVLQLYPWNIYPFIYIYIPICVCVSSRDFLDLRLKWLTSKRRPPYPAGDAPMRCSPSVWWQTRPVVGKGFLLMFQSFRACVRVCVRACVWYVCISYTHVYCIFYLHVYIMHIYICVCVSYKYARMERERERGRERERERERKI